jgi:hypothetical protein
MLLDMKATFALATVSLVLPLSAQTTTGPGIARTAPTIAGPANSGTVNIGSGNPGAPVNPGALRGAPPPVVGQTFSRPIISSPLNPNAPAPAPTLGFPPAAGVITPTATNTGVGVFFDGSTFGPPDARTFPPGPTVIGNTVGQNFVAPATNFPQTRALSLNFPPGTVVRTNAFGAPEAIVPPPALVPTVPQNAVGAPAGSEVNRVGPIGTPPVIQPPTAPIPAPLPPPRNPGARIPSVPRP